MSDVPVGRKPKHDPNENHELFDKYVKPNLDEIRSLTFFYANDKQKVDEYYNSVLVEMYKYVHTYNPDSPLKTWIHIVTKRHVYLQNKKAHEEASTKHGIVYDFDHDNGEGDDELLCGGPDMVFGNTMDNLSDKVLSALQQTPPTLLSAFILYYQGYDFKRIVEIEYGRGYLDHDGDDAVKTIANRIYMAKKMLKKNLANYGIRRTEKNIG